MSNVTKQGLVELIKSSDRTQVASLPEVQKRFIENYNQANKSGGELAYQKNLAAFQSALAQDTFKDVTSIGAYRAWIMIAIQGYDLDPTQGEIYIVPYGGTINLQQQAPYLVRKLKETKQISSVEPAQLIFDGDKFSIVDGMVTYHEAKLQSRKIIAAYVKMTKWTKDGKGDKVCFIYYPEDWANWKKKSKLKDGDNWSGGDKVGELKQPVGAFLKTKVVLHACKEKCWMSGKAALTDEWYPEVIKDTEAESEAGEQAEINSSEPETIAFEETKHSDENLNF